MGKKSAMMVTGTEAMDVTIYAGKKENISVEMELLRVARNAMTLTFTVMMVVRPIAWRSTAEMGYSITFNNVMIRIQLVVMVVAKIV